MARCRVGVPLVPLLVSVVSAQNPPQSDPQAVALATQAMTVLMNGVAVSDVTLSGNAVWTSGTDGIDRRWPAHSAESVYKGLVKEDECCKSGPQMAQFRRCWCRISHG